MLELMTFLDSEYISYEMDIDWNTDEWIANVDDYNLDMQIIQTGETFELYENIFLCKNVTNLDIDEVKDIVSAIKTLGGIL